ncbi:MAG: metal ABC transporter permease [Nitrospirae bacterium]|nr:metal ABC transporter permease [Nitrospirota bacterium]
MDILSALHYEFIKRAFIAGLFIALACSVLGVLLVLRRLALIGDGLAHVTFGSVAVGLLLKQNPALIAIPIVVVSSVGIMKLMQKAKLYGSLVGISSVLIRIYASFNINLPTGATIVMGELFPFFIAFLLRRAVQMYGN